MKGCLRRLFFDILFLILFLGIVNSPHAFGADKNEETSGYPKVSIVMPVYNVAPYLNQALDSARNQTLKDMEIICVNDGSTDDSLKILKKHAQKDCRIKIINQKNMGVSEARNVGMRAASAKYIYFFDSDDMLAPHTMEKSVENLEKYNADMIKFRVVRFVHGIGIVIPKYRYKDSYVHFCQWNDSYSPFKFFKENAKEAWSRVYRKSLITDNSVEFNRKIGFGEDLIFNYILGAYAKKVVVDDNIGYFYRVGRPGSLVSDGYKSLKRRLDQHLDIIHELWLNRHLYRKEYTFEYVLDYFSNFIYKIIQDFKSPYEKSFYAKKAYAEIYENFAKECNIEIKASHRKKLEDLKSWYKDVNPEEFV